MSTKNVKPTKSKPASKDKNYHTLEHVTVVHVPVDQIKPNEYNPNRQSEHDFELLCRSIEEDGFTQPILVNKISNRIVDGEHRWRACKTLGMPTVPVIYVDFTQAQAMISTLRHNRARGSENINMAADVLKELKEMGDLDHAADSLLLDPLDIKIMLEDVPMAELNLRIPGEQYTVAETENLISQEKDLQIEKKEQERVMSIKDKKKYTFQFTYEWDQSWLIERLVLGRNNAKNKADELYKLCKEMAPRVS